MNAPFSSILTCSLATASLQVTGYAKSAEGVFDDAGVRVGTRVSFDLDGQVWAASVAELASALAALQAAAATDGADFSITASGATVLEQVLASDCAQAPRVALAYGDSQGPTHQDVRLTVEAVLAADDQAGVISVTETTSTAVNHEGLRTVTIDGTVRVSAGTDLSAAVLARVPARPAGWQQTYSYQVGGSGDAALEGTYQVVQTELVAEFPASGGDRVVDGERTITTALDEHNRQVTTTAYSYVGPYAQDYVEAQHAALRAAGGLLRAEISVTAHKTLTATGRFDVLTARGAGVLELVETVSHARSGPLLREVRYPGTTPLIVAEADPGYAYSQAGRAIGLRAYPQPPAYLFAEANLAEAPQVVFSRPNDQEFETAWAFRFLFPDEQATAFPHDRTGSGGFY